MSEQDEATEALAECLPLYLNADSDIRWYAEDTIKILAALGWELRKKGDV